MSNLNQFQNTMTAAKADKNLGRPFTSEKGTGAVLSAIKSLYQSVEFDSISNTAMSELKNLVTKEGKEKPIVTIFNDTMKVGTFVNYNISLLARPATNQSVSLADAFSLDFQSGYTNDINTLRATNVADKDTQIEDFIEKVQAVSEKVMSDIYTNRFVLKEHTDEYEVRFTVGSKPGIFQDFNRFCSRTASPDNIEYQALRLQATYPILFQEMEYEASKVISNIEKILGTSIYTSRARGVVPLGYDFSVLFSQHNSNSGEFNIVAPSISENNKKRYSKNWELGVEVRYRGSQYLTTSIAKLSALDIIVLPTLKISRELMAYLTQCTDSSKIKISTAHAWTINWLDEAKGIRNRKGDINKRTFFTDAKSIAVSNSLLDNFEFSKKKEAFGIKSPDTRADANGICVNFEGKFLFAPNNSIVEAATIEAYEEAYIKMVQECSKYDEPIISNGEDYGYLKSNANTSSIIDLHNTINSFQTCALISNWDLNMCGSVQTENPAKLTTVSISGAMKANVVGKADLLRSPIGESMDGLLGKSGVTSKSLHELDSCHYMSAIYSYLKTNGKIKDLDEYLLDASRAVAPDRNKLKVGDFEYGIYPKMSSEFSTIISKDCTQVGSSNQSNPNGQQSLDSLLNNLSKLNIMDSDYDPNFKDFVNEFNRFYSFFRIWTTILHVSSSYWLEDWERNEAIAKGIPFEGVDSSIYYIDPYGPVNLFTPIAESYVVGRAFSEICKDMLAYINTPKNIVLTHDASAPKPHMGTIPQLPTFVKICESLGPFLSTFGHTIPNSEQILKEADEESKKFVLDPNVVVADVPGMKGEFEVFSHQHKALQLLANEPRAAILDISPGGGKTIIGLVECLQLMGKGKVKLPLFVAPNKLIKNWIKDLNKEVTEFKFNCIPITGTTLAKWGEEKLSRMIKNAPPNTIFHTDTLFIKDHTKKTSLNLLSNTADIYTNLEWMKQFDWDYILFDESHTMKNAKGSKGGSIQSRLFAELTLRESVKFIRLASGTVIHKDVDDIIGQARLFDPLIFRTQKEFEKKYSKEKEPKNWAPDAPKRIREHMSRFCAVARAKSKDWAYALPMQKRKESSSWIVEMDAEFKKAYEHICAKTIEAMGEDSELVKLMKSDDLSEDSLDNMDEEDEEDALAGKLNIYISRLEQFLICPENDPLNGWNGLDFSKLKVPKMARIIELLDEHMAIKNAGKVIIFVRHISAVDGIFDRLPARFKSKTVKYSSSNTEGLEAFEYDPKIRIIIGVEMSMNTGLNLQFADRIIRVEIPWASGDVSQGIARIFRPDFQNKYNREFIYDDWIIVNDSLEIPKLCRLISGSIRVVQFEEYGSDNKDYMNLQYLPPMSLNLKRFMNPEVAVRRYDQVSEYFTEYDTLSNIQSEEFKTERSRYINPVTGKMEVDPYVKLKRGAELVDSAVMAFTPLLSHQGFVNDPDNDLLVPFHKWINENKKYLKNTSLISAEKTLAFCEFGYGYIIKMGRTTLDNIPPEVVIRTNSGELIKAPTSSLYIVGSKGKLDDDRIKKYVGTNSGKSRFDQFISPDPRDVEGLICKDATGFSEFMPDGSIKKILIATNPNPAQPKVQIQTQPTATTKITSGKPAVRVTKISDEIETDPSPKPMTAVERLREKLAKLRKSKEVKPATTEKPENTSYVPENTGKDGELVGSVCVISDSLYLAFNAKDPDADILQSLKFNKVKPFVGIEVKNLMEFNAAVSFISNRLTLHSPDDIYALAKRFSKRTKLFNGQFEQTDNKFLMLNYKPSKDKNAVKLYYIIEDSKLFLVFNAEANVKATTALLNKKPKGVNDKFKKYESTLMRAVLTKRGAISVINRVNAQAKISNYAELMEEISLLTIV